MRIVHVELRADVAGDGDLVAQGHRAVDVRDVDDRDVELWSAASQTCRAPRAGRRPPRGRPSRCRRAWSSVFGIIACRTTSKLFTVLVHVLPDAVSLTPVVWPRRRKASSSWRRSRSGSSGCSRARVPCDMSSGAPGSVMSTRSNVAARSIARDELLGVPL